MKPFTITVNIVDEIPDKIDARMEKLKKRFHVDNIYGFDADSYLYLTYDIDLENRRHEVKKCNHFLIEQIDYFYSAHNPYLVLSGYALGRDGSLWFENLTHEYLTDRAGTIGDFFKYKHYLLNIYKTHTGKTKLWAKQQILKLKPNYLGVADMYRKELNKITRPPQWL